MRTLILLLLSGCWLSIFSQASAQSSGNKRAENRLPILDKTGVGVLELGMPIEDIYLYVNKDQIYKVYTFDANKRKTSYQIYAADKKTRTFNADIMCKGSSCIVSRITVWHKAYPTVRNVRVGQTFRSIKENYQIRDIFWKDANLMVQTREGIFFYIDTSTLPDSYIKYKRFVSLPETAVISALMVEI